MCTRPDLLAVLFRPTAAVLVRLQPAATPATPHASAGRGGGQAAAQPPLQLRGHWVGAPAAQPLPHPGGGPAGRAIPGA